MGEDDLDKDEAYVALASEVIISAVRENDHRFFSSQVFVFWGAVANVNPSYIYDKVFQRLKSSRDNQKHLPSE